MKTRIIYIISILLLMPMVWGTSCKSDSHNCSDCDSVRMMLEEYIVRDSMKSALLTSYDEHLSRFGNIQDSIEMFKRAIDSLKLVVRGKGKSSGNESNELQKYMQLLQGLISQNQQLAEQLKAEGVSTPSMDRLIKLIYSNVESNQAELAETRTEIVSLQTEVKGLESKVQKLEVENEELKQNIEILDDGSKRVYGSVKVTQPTERKARKIQTVKMSFVLEANLHADHRSLPVYFRVLDPLGKVLDPSGEFEFEGRSIAYTMKTFVNYTGKSVRSQIEWNKSPNVTLEPGTYTVDFFIDSYKGSSDNFTLEK